jgi:hypothetical protein
LVYPIESNASQMTAEYIWSRTSESEKALGGGAILAFF